MRLNKPQAQIFENWRRFRISPPRNADYFRAVWRRYLLFVIVLLPLAALGFAMGNPWVSAFVAGAFFGVVVTNESDFRRFRQLWPALEAVLDWNKIDQLLQERINRLNQPKPKPPDAPT